MKRMFVALSLAGIVVAGGVTAAEDPVGQRQGIMKNNGAAMGTLVQMARGQMEFDDAKALLALRVLNSGAQGYGELFPDAAADGKKTAASEEIWKNMAGFQAILDKLRIATNEAVAAPPTEQAAIGPILNVVGGFCNECHQAFRIQTN